jgi:tetratricopeptide (TPR) repeat protein
MPNDVSPSTRKLCVLSKRHWGQVTTALPEVEARLAQVAGWWQRHRSGQPVPEAPDGVLLARALISALDIVTDAHFAQRDWPSALLRTETSLELKRALKHPAEDVFLSNMNRAVVLGRLRRFDEAKAELETCLPVFQNNAAMCSKVRNSLADPFFQQGDIIQAITQVRSALALCEQLPDPTDRAISHHNLANFLASSAIPSARAESPSHQLAAFLYRLVARLAEHLNASLHTYIILFRRAHTAGSVLAIPRVAALLADPAFAPLELWLREREEPLDQLQVVVDQFLDQARQAALAQP